MSLPERIEELRERRTLKIVKQKGRYHVGISDGQRALFSAPRKVVLILHGYNNTESAAKDKYKDLYEQLLWILRSETFVENVWEVFWPGYWPWIMKNQYVSWTSYSWKAFEAERIGTALAECLESLTEGGKEVLFIAHSLGCRIVLEAIRQFLVTKRCTVTGICLMAAAVPTVMLQAGERLRDAADYAQRRYILHSHADRILRWAFPLGQLPVDLELSEAVGRFGNPNTCWENHYENVVNTDLDHGEYYTGLKKHEWFAQSRTAPTIGRMFGRALPRYLPETDPYVVDWKVYSRFVSEERSVPATRSY